MTIFKKVLVTLSLCFALVHSAGASTITLDTTGNGMIFAVSSRGADGWSALTYSQNGALLFDLSPTLAASNFTLLGGSPGGLLGGQYVSWTTVDGQGRFVGHLRDRTTGQTATATNVGLFGGITSDGRACGTIGVPACMDMAGNVTVYAAQGGTVYAADGTRIAGTVGDDVNVYPTFFNPQTTIAGTGAIQGVAGQYFIVNDLFADEAYLFGPTGLIRTVTGGRLYGVLSNGFAVGSQNGRGVVIDPLAGFAITNGKDLLGLSDYEYTAFLGAVYNGELDQILVPYSGSYGFFSAANPFAELRGGNEVPEPGTWMMLVIGSGLMAAARARNNKKPEA